MSTRLAWTAEQVALWHRRLERQIGQARRMYAAAEAFAYATGASGEVVSGGPMPDPTVSAAMDARRAVVRMSLDTVATHMALMESASNRILELLGAGERAGPDTIGDSGVWTSATAEREERRAAAGAARRHGVWRSRP